MEAEDDNERTTPIGLFHFAHSYWRSAVALEKAKVKATHRDSPISFLYFHAMELYLKAFLRLHDVSVEELSKKYRHHVLALSGAAKTLGFHLDDEDEVVVKMMDAMDLTDVRYIRTGRFLQPSHEALHRTCRSFHETVEQALREKGHPVRRYETE